MTNKNQNITRRDFLRETAGGAGILAVGTGSFGVSIARSRAASAGNDANPFAYDVGRLRQTDPKMLLVPHYGVRKDVNLVIDRTKEKSEEWVRDVRKLNDMHLTPEQIVEELRRKIIADTGIPPAGFPSYVNVLMRVSVLGILGYLNRTNSSAPASKT